MSAPNPDHQLSRDWRSLAAFALGALIATEIARRMIVQPPAAQGWQLIYWFTDRVFFDGKWLVLLALALAPARESLPLRLMGPAGGFLLMVGSFLQLSDPVFLLLAGFVAGAIIKSLQLTDGPLLLMAAGGLMMGIPINGFTGLMAAKAGFPAPLMKSLFGSVAGVGCVSIATSFAALFLLGRRLWRRRRKA